MNGATSKTGEGGRAADPGWRRFRQDSDHEKDILNALAT